ncbi:MAG: hypothetical protein ACO3R6_04835, partial [Lutimaribacter sp.]
GDGGQGVARGDGGQGGIVWYTTNRGAAPKGNTKYSVTDSRIHRIAPVSWPRLRYLTHTIHLRKLVSKEHKKTFKMHHFVSWAL